MGFSPVASQVYVNGWPHVFLCSLPGVAIPPGALLFADRFSGLSPRQQKAYLAAARSALRLKAIELMRKAAAESPLSSSWAFSRPPRFSSSLAGFSPSSTIQSPRVSSLAASALSPHSSPVKAVVTCRGSSSSSAGSVAPQSVSLTCSAPSPEAGGLTGEGGASEHNGSSNRLPDVSTSPPRSARGGQPAEHPPPTALTSDSRDSETRQNRLEDLVQFQRQRGPSRHFRCDICTQQRCPRCSLEKPRTRPIATRRTGKSDAKGVGPTAAGGTSLAGPDLAESLFARNFEETRRTLGSPPGDSPPGLSCPSLLSGPFSDCPSASRATESRSTPGASAGAAPCTPSLSRDRTLPQNIPKPDTPEPAVETTSFFEGPRGSGSALLGSEKMEILGLSSGTQRAGQSLRTGEDLCAYRPPSPPAVAAKSAGEEQGVCGAHEASATNPKAWWGGTRAAEGEATANGSACPGDLTPARFRALSPSEDRVSSPSFCTPELCCSLLTCDFCARSFHLACLGLPLSFAPPDDREWLCGLCLDRVGQVLKARGLWKDTREERAEPDARDVRATGSASKRRGNADGEATKKREELRTPEQERERVRADEEERLLREDPTYCEEARTGILLDKPQQGQNQKENSCMPDKASAQEARRTEHNDQGSMVHGGQDGGTWTIGFFEAEATKVDETFPPLSCPENKKLFEMDDGAEPAGGLQPQQRSMQCDNEEESAEEAQEPDEWLVQFMTLRLSPAAMRQQVTSLAFLPT